MHNSAQTDNPLEKVEIIKCGFGTVNIIKMNMEKFSLEKQQILNEILQRPQKHTSIVSPSGFFRVHFDTTGFETPRYDNSLSPLENAQQVALALDSAYNFEVTYLGYPPPPKDGNEGGDDLYDVYITSADGSYGFTEWETPLGNQKYTSHIQIHYSFESSGFATHGFDAMRVTVAHELHHAIQMGCYTRDKVDVDLFFYELTSTSMEEFVFDEVNDYYAYMPSYFNNPGVSFVNTSGYDIALWNIFLKDKFHFNIIRRQWELFPQYRALNAINISLNEYNSSFKEAFHEFAVWNFFTGYRAKPGEYFEEASAYPLIKPTTVMNFDTPHKKINSNILPAANSYILLINNNIIPRDSLYILVTNSDYQGAVTDPNASASFEYNLYNYPEAGSIRLNELYDYYFSFITSVPQIWSHSEFIDNELIGEHKFFTNYNYAFPSPFVYSKHTFIFIPVLNPSSENVDLNIYTSSMELIYSQSRTLAERDGQTGLMWNALDNDNQRLASGVYIYAVKSGENTSLGKLVIFND